MQVNVEYASVISQVLRYLVKKYKYLILVWKLADYEVLIIFFSPNEIHVFPSETKLYAIREPEPTTPKNKKNTQLILVFH